MSASLKGGDGVPYSFCTAVCFLGVSRSVEFCKEACNFGLAAISMSLTSDKDAWGQCFGVREVARDLEGLAVVVIGSCLIEGLVKGESFALFLLFVSTDTVDAGLITLLFFVIVDICPVFWADLETEEGVSSSLDGIS